MKEIDARGLPCPGPVLQTKVMLDEEKPDRIKVIVDNAASSDNVQRFLRSRGFTVALERRGDEYCVSGHLDGAAPQQAVPVVPLEQTTKKILVLCATDRMGFGDDELGRKLLVSFLRTLKEMGPDLWRLVFVNNGVKLTVDGAEVLADLQALEQGGLKVMVCGTCLTHFNLLERKMVGETTNMLDIVTAMQLADKVINL
ncbi:MAG: SirA family protein [Desulfobulbaceae bacterium A2]|nr:MAG: SirA family protein [Desulfobulbaceae bacterium A2]